MIVPLTPEKTWKRMLSELPAWDPPRKKTIIISPHPDDETLGAGGLVDTLSASGVDVFVVAVTDGENAYAGVNGLGPIRAAEQAAALAELGVAPERILRLHRTDSGLRDDEAGLLNDLRAIVTPDTHVIAPWTGDFHPDHEVCGRAARTAARAVAAQLTFYFFWTWHRGTPATLHGLNLVRFPLTPEAMQRREAALRCHRSQLQHAGGHPILPENLLQPMQRPFEIYLPA